MAWPGSSVARISAPLRIFPLKARRLEKTDLPEHQRNGVGWVTSKPCIGREEAASGVEGATRAPANWTGEAPGR